MINFVQVGVSETLFQLREWC